MTASMSGRSASAMGGGWNRLGPSHCTGEARSEKTGSVSQKTPRSLSSTVEWPNRNSVRSGAPSSASRVKAWVGTGWSGTVSAGLFKKAHIKRNPSRKPVLGLLIGLRNRPSAPEAAGVSGLEKGRGEAALRSGMRRAPTGKARRARHALAMGVKTCGTARFSLRSPPQR
ncbi:protein of unknown function (plasmid) [Ralstonia solanacearum PSI07]|nr:protein of unknown function [Ralstonia solanacearum PSI07]